MLRLSALFLGLLGLVGLYFHSTLPVTGRIRPGFFVFYTNLSNLLLAVYQLTLGVSGHDPQCGVFRWLSSAGVALSMTLCIFVTHLIYQWVLVPSAKKGGKALSDIGSPPGLTCSSNLSSEGRFIATTTSALFTSGEATGLSETITEQLAVPPRISGP